MEDIPLEEQAVQSEQPSQGEPPAQTAQPNNPLHGVTLEAMLTYLVENLGWEDLAFRVHVRCFEYNPSIKSSLVFLRRTDWARKKVEKIYLKMTAKKNDRPKGEDPGFIM